MQVGSGLVECNVSLQRYLLKEVGSDEVACKLCFQYQIEQHLLEDAADKISMRWVKPNKVKVRFVVSKDDVFNQYGAPSNNAELRAKSGFEAQFDARIESKKARKICSYRESVDGGRLLGQGGCQVDVPISERTSIGSN